jgi:hypothetical protein
MFKALNLPQEWGVFLKIIITFLFSTKSAPFLMKIGKDFKVDD